MAWIIALAIGCYLLGLVGKIEIIRVERTDLEEALEDAYRAGAEGVIAQAHALADQAMAVELATEPSSS